MYLCQIDNFFSLMNVHKAAFVNINLNLKDLDIILYYKKE